MKLSLFTDIALRTLMRLAGNPEHAFSTKELAKELAVSSNHLTKVVARLARLGYVTSRRGNQGGIWLAKEAESIRIGDVVVALEDATPLVECFREDGGNCTLDDACRLRARLAKARACFLEDLNGSTLADIAYRKESTDKAPA
ncbi:MAG: Rrf2 family transcriptional regulator [Paracoccaceae bacterium]|nr:Rrf2 family transcriptional regulator [Paracoccaceae bacterium]